MGETKQALLIKSNGEISVINFTNETSYQVVSDAVGGYIELIRVADDIDLWVNEEGKLNRLPYNYKATAIWNFYFGETDVLSGDIVITGGSDSNGDSNGLSSENSNKLQVIAESAGEPSEQDLARYETILDFFA